MVSVHAERHDSVGRPAKLNRSSVGRFNFSVNLSSLEAGKEIVIEISDMKFVNLK